MARSVGEAIETLEASRRALLADVSRCSEEQLRRRPADDGWCLLEVVEHLVIAEREVLGDLPSLAELPRRKRSLRNRLLYPVTLFILKRGITVEVPSAGMVPEGVRSLRELEALWEENRDWLRRFVEALASGDAWDGAFAHPVTGPLDLGRTLKLLQVHHDSHLRDVRKLQRVLAQGD